MPIGNLPLCSYLYALKYNNDTMYSINTVIITHTLTYPKVFEQKYNINKSIRVNRVLVYEA